MIEKFESLISFSLFCKHFRSSESKIQTLSHIPPANNNQNTESPQSITDGVTVILELFNNSDNCTYSKTLFLS